MTHNWNTLTPMPKATTEFGSPLLDDYGQDDLFPIIVDFHGAVDPASLDRMDLDIAHIMGEEGNGGGSGRRLTDEEIEARIRAMDSTPVMQIVAVLDDEQPAIATSTQVVEPDFFENGYSWWIGEDATVGCATDMQHRAADVAERGGWLARTGSYPSAYGFVVMPHNFTAMLSIKGPLSKHNDQYALWQMVRHTVMVQSD